MTTTGPARSNFHAGRVLFTTVKVFQSGKHPYICTVRHIAIDGIWLEGKDKAWIGMHENDSTTFVPMNDITMDSSCGELTTDSLVIRGGGDNSVHRLLSSIQGTCVFPVGPDEKNHHHGEEGKDARGSPFPFP